MFANTRPTISFAYDIELFGSDLSGNFACTITGIFVCLFFLHFVYLILSHRYCRLHFARNSGFPAKLIKRNNTGGATAVLSRIYVSYYKQSSERRVDGKGEGRGGGGREGGGGRVREGGKGEGKKGRRGVPVWGFHYSIHLIPQ